MNTVLTQRQGKARGFCKFRSYFRSLVVMQVVDAYHSKRLQPAYLMTCHYAVTTIVIISVINITVIITNRLSVVIIISTSSLFLYASCSQVLTYSCVQALSFVSKLVCLGQTYTTSCPSLRTDNCLSPTISACIRCALPPHFLNYFNVHI